MHFADHLLTACLEKNSRLVVGLDPHPQLLPPHIIEAQKKDTDATRRQIIAQAIIAFNKAVIEAVADYAVAVKPQLSLYEPWGPAGIAAYEATVEAAHQAGLLVIADAKRNDIGSSAEGYAAAFLGAATGVDTCDATAPSWEADAITINPYLGSDGVAPFLLRADRGKGVFALVRTSNPSAAQIQNLLVGETPVFMKVAELVHAWGAKILGESGYSALGAVVGATDPSAAKTLRRLMPHTIFLVPGFGAQGGSVADVAVAFDQDGLGAIVNSSRDILFAYRKHGDERAYASLARQAAQRTNASINAALGIRGE
jgi:orotidine-5'-phosphate decarboxylase